MPPIEREGKVADKDMITMSRRDSKRLHLIHQALDRKITQDAAAGVLELSTRQFRRLLRRVRAEGDEGICHRSRGRASNNRIRPQIKRRALQLFKREYADFNLVHATEKLSEVHGITISDETLRLWLNQASIPYKKRRVRKHRQRRERRACIGELVQIDGSHHDWFEGRGPWCVFMGYIDDATGTVFGRFYDYEGTMPAMDSMKRYIRQYGIPQSVYLDKHTTYKSWAKQTVEEQLSGQEPMSHFEKSLAALEIEVIHANSPQAKGRVERLFKTLQDRLLREMRLLGIKSIEEANLFLDTYLPKYNKRFRKQARSEADLHRPALHTRDLDRILCLKEERTVKNDFTIAYAGKLYQIEQAIRAKKVIVEERLDGSLHITYKGQDLHYRVITEKLKRETPQQALVLAIRKPWTPPADHPWKKRPVLSPRRHQEQRSVP
jgi:transposase-like protein